MNVLYRSFQESDFTMILSDWLKHNRHQDPCTHIPSRTYFKNESARIQALLKSCKVAVICNPEDDQHVYGWVCFTFIGEAFVIHYAFVKRTYQKFGLMSALLAHIYPRFGKDEVGITYWSRQIDKKREKYRLQYNPYLKERI